MKKLTKTAKTSNALSKMAEAAKKNKAVLLATLRKKAGNVSAACEAANVTRKTFYNYCESDENFNEAVNDIKELLLDFTESKLMEKISEGDSTCILFHLKTIGKSRGYTERTEMKISTEINVGLPEEMT